MNNREIDKLLSMLDKKSLDDVKRYLNEQKELNTKKLRQETFEEYLTTNYYQYNTEAMPKLYSDDNIQIFSNYISIYLINKNFFNIQTPKLIKGQSKIVTSAHRFQVVKKDVFDKLIEKIEKMTGHYYFDVRSMESDCERKNKFYDVEYVDELYNKIHSEKFSKKEIDTADILLNNPKYIIYSKVPILKAESEIGKAYILGCKRF